ncbi:MAG: DHH family phosphoesterase [SAR324 cluster bacterium]|nr:DHH family phosphoesterase [SAR324 cluster bacterium]
MERYDVFNGDADGLCALQQLRLHEPTAATLVTGVKRDIHLLSRVPQAADAHVTVLDISLDSNREALNALLQRGIRVRWFDHHFAGDIPDHPGFEAHIDTAPEVCTSLIVDAHLGGEYRAWAVAAAFGDNLAQSARKAAEALNLNDAALGELQTLGELLNYNAYGESLADLHFAPDALYRALHPYADPLAFFRRAPEAQRLREGFAADMAHAGSREPILDDGVGRVFRWPCEPWARRVMGVYANRLANEAPEKATALIVDNADGTLRISVRAPLARPQGADDLCRAFPSGGGRKAAAGINELPETELERFLRAFRVAFMP